jgi:hypothetical protein
MRMRELGSSVGRPPPSGGQTHLRIHDVAGLSVTEETVHSFYTTADLDSYSLIACAIVFPNESFRVLVDTIWVTNRV